MWVVIETEIMTQIGEKLISCGNSLSQFIDIVYVRMVMLDSHLFSIRAATWLHDVTHTIHYTKTVQGKCFDGFENRRFVSQIFLFWQLFSVSKPCAIHKHIQFGDRALLLVDWSSDCSKTMSNVWNDRRMEIKRKGRKINLKTAKKWTCMFVFVCFLFSFLLSRCLMAKFFSFTL